MNNLTIQQKEVIGTIEAAATELKSYLEVAINYAENNSEVPEIFHISLILDKMSENVEGLNRLFVENKIPKII